jgi:predicted permease
MRPLRAWLRRLASVCGGDRRDRELADELESHIQLHIDDNVRAGMSPTEARRQALLTLGGVDQTKERYRDRRGVPIVENLIRDIRYAMRRLRRAPGFTCAAVVMVALGVGANTSTFSQLYAIVIRPLPYDHPDRLVMIGTAMAGEIPEPGWIGGMSEPDYRDLLATTTSLAEVGAHRRRVFNLSGGTEPQQVPGTAATASFFSIFGVRPQLGRTFTPPEEVAGADGVVVLSHRLWRQAFGADPSIVDRRISLDGELYTVIGVVSSESAPYDSLVRTPADLWVPLVLTPEERSDRGNRSLGIVARLKDGITREQAVADLQRISRRLSLDHPVTNSTATLDLALLSELITGPDGPVMLMLQGAVLFVLLIACVNIANLLLARGVLSAPEVGIRLALGASRSRIISQLVTENLLLFLIGALLALPIAEYSNRWFLARVPFPLPEFLKFEMNLPVLAFTGAVTLVAGVVSGLLPALLMTARAPVNSLKHRSRGTAIAVMPRRVSSALVGAEIALAVILLTGAGLMIRSLILLHRVDPGFDPKGVLIVQVSLPAARYANPEQMAAFVWELTPKVQAVPGVTGAAWTTRPPLYGVIDEVELSIDGRAGDEVLKPTAQYAVISSDYFTTLGVPLHAGRFFDNRDAIHAGRAVLVNETMAARYWPNQSPIGQRIRRDSSGPTQPWTTIVGVVADARHGTLRYPVAPEVYVPIAQSPESSLFLVLRASGNPASLLRPVKEAIWSLDSELPASNVRTMDEVMEQEFWFHRTIATALGSFSVIALILSVFGTFAVVSYLTAQRTQEIGVRMTFGAARRDIFRLVFRQVGTPIGLGVALGTALALALNGALGGLLYGVTRFDPPTLIGVLALLIACAAIAVYLPARRAAGMDPAAALRQE